MDFKDFRHAVKVRIEELSGNDLFVVDSDKYDIWNMYLDSFPKGTNEIYRERREYDCQSCKKFIRDAGNIVAIDNGEVKTVWGIDIGGNFQVVADAMDMYVKSLPVKDIFLHYENDVGVESNHQLTENGATLTWNHFYCNLPNRFVKGKHSIQTLKAEKRDNKNVLERGIKELTIDAIETVLELIEQNSLYRGEEHKSAVESFLACKKAYEESENKELFLWEMSIEIGGLSRFRNTVIGTLVTDIANGLELDDAVKMFESKVAPANYKRPKALVTKAMVKTAEKKVEELGILESLSRRYASIDDITINNVIFADKQAKREMSVFDEIAESSPVNRKSFNKVDEVSIDRFIETILPKADSIDLLLENRHVSNLVSLVAPVNKESKNMLKWGNNFTWAYNGEVADSIKERVKRAGGDVFGVLRCSLSWFNYDDLDIHVIEPNGNRIHYGSKINQSTSGKLDVDMNAGGGHTREGVENITWEDKRKMLEGIYIVVINQYQQRENVDIGFDCEIEYEGDVHKFSYDRPVVGNVEVARFEFSKSGGVKFIKNIQSVSSSRDIWGLKTEQFQRVKMIMNSPNHWDGEKTGNKHYFFMLDKCLNPERARGFFNEFLSEELREHRKVFEILGSKMKTEKSDNQLSGVGFSSTQGDHVFCKVSGSFSRTIKITF